MQRLWRSLRSLSALVTAFCHSGDIPVYLTAARRIIFAWREPVHFYDYVRIFDHSDYAPKIADRSSALRMRARVHNNLLQLIWAL